MIWCYNCQQQTQQSLYSKSCAKCNSFAIQQMTNNQNGTNFKPYVIGQPQQQQISNNLRNQPQNRNLQQDQDQIIMFIQNIPIRSPYNIFTVYRVYQFTPVKKVVTKEFIDNLPKTKCVKQCAICQQFEDQTNQETQNYKGIQLKCKHVFHKTCIQPWFQNSTTCPTCRTQVI